MVRSFRPEPVERSVVERLIDAGRRAPAAGNTSGRDFVVLCGPAQTATYWDVTLPRGPARDGFRFPGLLDAPVLVVPVVDPGAYVARYAEPDKARSELGDGAERWPVAYWTVDLAFAAMRIVDAAADEGLGALFFGMFEHVPAVLAAVGVPEGREAIGTIAIGVPDPDREVAGRSASRPRRPLDDVVHWGAL